VLVEQPLARGVIGARRAVERRRRLVGIGGVDRLAAVRAEHLGRSDLLAQCRRAGSRAGAGCERRALEQQRRRAPLELVGRSSRARASSSAAWRPQPDRYAAPSATSAAPRRRHREPPPALRIAALVEARGRDASCIARASA
jgi:hypothetical protein